MTCAECRFFERFEDPPHDRDMGWCHRLPPFTAITREGADIYHPDSWAAVTVWDDWWCGEFESGVEAS
jgi:hypothetical protein